MLRTALFCETFLPMMLLILADDNEYTTGVFIGTWYFTGITAPNNLALSECCAPTGTMILTGDINNAT